LTTTRKKGAQPGNLNALKHGFYSRRFHKQELDDLDTIPPGVLSEIALMRVSLRRLFEYMADEPPEFEAWVKYLPTISAALSKLGILLKVQAGDGQNETDVFGILTDAIKAINSETKPENP